MTAQPIRFQDGAAYERLMGVWSRLAGDAFLNWLAPGEALRWIDVGCGNGAFTELICQRGAPASVEGIDPSEGQLAFARERPGARLARFKQGNAMALPFADDAFDAAVMALVLFFVPDPPKGVAEMARVVAPGGSVSAYAWDIPGGGFPIEALWAEMRGMGLTHAVPPSVNAARLDVMRTLWAEAGLTQVEMREFIVHRTFENFDEYWATCQLSSSVDATITAMQPDDVETLRTRVRARLPPDSDGRIICTARANAVKGVVA